MAHNLTINKFGRAEFAYCGDKPWHGLGTLLPKHATSREALEAAGLDWSVGQEPLYLHHPDGTQSVVDDVVANVRQDTREVLGIVSPDYKLIQNRQSLQLMDDIVGQAHAMFETAGSLRGGRQIFALAKLPTEYVVGPQDTLQQYLLMRAAHDATCSYHLRFTGVRVVCENTMNMALGQGTPHQYTIQHKGNVDVRIADIRNALGISVKYFNLLGEKCEALTHKRVTELMEAQYLDRVIPVPEGDDVTLSQIHSAKATQETIAYLFREGRGNELSTAKGTLWGLFNATTEWLDHVNVLTQKGTPKANGFENALFGSSEGVRQRAWDTALALLK